MPLLDHFNLDGHCSLICFLIFLYNFWVLEQSKPVVEMPPPIEKVPVMPVLGGYLFISNSQSESEFLYSDIF
jgi:hypothetical protein